MSASSVLRQLIASAVAPADGSAGLADGGSGHADALNSGPTWAAPQANLHDHVVRLSKWRWCYCLRRRHDGYDKASSSNQPDHSSPPLFTRRTSFFQLKGTSNNDNFFVELIAG